MTTTTEIHTDLTWTPEAWDKYHEIGAQIELVRAYFGDAVANEMYHSFAVSILSLLASGPARISTAFDFDGLYISTRYITMGLVFHKDSVEGMLRRINRLGRHNLTVDEVRPDWPRTGAWGMHS